MLSTIVHRGFDLIRLSLLNKHKKASNLTLNVLLLPAAPVINFH